MGCVISMGEDFLRCEKKRGPSVIRFLQQQQQQLRVRCGTKSPEFSREAVKFWRWDLPWDLLSRVVLVSAEDAPAENRRGG
jgi:hypothetical protein